MLEKNFRMTVETGVARYAAALVHIAGGFSSAIIMMHQGKSVDVKHVPDCILQIMNLGISIHSSFTIRADGIDEIQAMEAITDHLEGVKTINRIFDLKYR